MTKKGLVLINTGDGKGKTTAALGMLIRSLGWGKKVCMIQFLKSPEFICGEKLFCDKAGIEFYSTGIGYSWTKTPEEQRESLKKAWEFSKLKIKEDNYDLIVLDEINSVLTEKNFPISDIITPEKVIEVLKERPIGQNIVLTGRNASDSLIEFADLVTEMKMIKHPYEKGIEASKGVEF